MSTTTFVVVVVVVVAVFCCCFFIATVETSDERCYNVMCLLGSSLINILLHKKQCRTLFTAVH